MVSGFASDEKFSALRPPALVHTTFSLLNSTLYNDAMPNLLIVIPLIFNVIVDILHNHHSLQAKKCERKKNFLFHFLGAKKV